MLGASSGENSICLYQSFWLGLHFRPFVEQPNVGGHRFLCGISFRAFGVKPMPGNHLSYQTRRVGVHSMTSSQPAVMRQNFEKGNESTKKSSARKFVQLQNDGLHRLGS